MNLTVMGPVRMRLLAAATVLASLGAFGALRANTAPATPPYRVAGIRAMLFYSGTGTFSPNLIGGKMAQNLWNTPIGEGSSGGASDETLVVVEVRGEAGSYEPDRRVELTATAERDTLVHRAQGVAILNRGGRSYVAFWLYGTGCRRVRLSARIVGQPAAPPVAAAIPFACGE